MCFLSFSCFVPLLLAKKSGKSDAQVEDAVRALGTALNHQQNTIRAVGRSLSPNRTASPNRGKDRGGDNSSLASASSAAGSNADSGGGGGGDELLRSISEALRIIMEVIERINAPIQPADVTHSVRKREAERPEKRSSGESRGRERERKRGRKEEEGKVKKKEKELCFCVF